MPSHRPILPRALSLCALMFAGALACGGEAFVTGWNPIQVQVGKDGESISYSLYIPKLKPKEVYPLVLHLHGTTGGPDNLKVNTAILRTLSLPEWQEKHPCFLIGPACPQNKTQPQWVNWPWGNGSYSLQKVPISISMQLVMATIDHLCATQPIDQDRIYATGGSMGGYGAWDAICRFPDRFAAAIPISGAGDPACGPLLTSLPIHAFAIATDPICPVCGSREMIAAIKAAGGTPLYTEFPMGWHLWDQVWDAKNAEYWQPDLLPWMFAQKRAHRK